MAARKSKTTVTAEPATVREVRAWASEKGIEVAQRGKLKAEVVEAFTAATGRPLVVAA